LDTPRWTVDKLEYTVDNIGLVGEKLDGLNSTTLDGQWKSKNIHTLTNQLATSKLGNTVDKPGWDIGYTYCRWTVDKHECTVGNIGHMVENLDGHEWTTLCGQWKPGCWTRQTASHDSTNSEARKKDKRAGTKEDV